MLAPLVRQEALRHFLDLWKAMLSAAWPAPRSLEALQCGFCYATRMAKLRATCTSEVASPQLRQEENENMALLPAPLQELPRPGAEKDRQEGDSSVFGAP